MDTIFDKPNRCDELKDPGMVNLIVSVYVPSAWSQVSIPQSPPHIPLMGRWLNWFHTHPVSSFLEC